MIFSFFSPENFEKYPPAGMFTFSHLFAAIICIALISLFVYLSKNLNQDKLRKLTKVAAIIFTILELIKIIYNFYYHYTSLDSWFPLAFCSIFIYALYLSGFAKGFLRKLGESFLVGGGIVGGSAFIVVPATSLALHPIYHYLCLYSLLFHSCMIYFGIMFFKTKIFLPTFKNYKYYVTIFLFFAFIALIINCFAKTNLMFLSQPFNMPLKIFYLIHDFSPFIYTLIILIGYSLSYLLPLSIYYLLKRTNKNIF